VDEELYTEDEDGSAHESEQQDDPIDPPHDDPTFLMPEDIHPNMEHKDIEQLRLLAGRLSADWRSPDFMAPALARRLRDFQFASEKVRINLSLGITVRDQNHHTIGNALVYASLPS
jgi:hypothetical protein